MTTRILSALVLAASCSAAGIAVAQPNDPPNQVPGNEAYYFEHPWERHQGPYDRRWYRDREQDYRQRGYPGIGPGRDMRIGQRVPRDWSNRQYAIENWRAHRLFAPPPGYAWYQIGADYALVDVRTGVIAQTRRAR
jgi:Ni/Co efflux regulator RcnB